MNAGSEPTAEATKWRDLFDREHLSTLALMVLALWLHATNTMLAATTLPVASEEIGGVQLISWAFSLYLLGSVIAGTTMSIFVNRWGLQKTMITCAVIYLLGCLVCGVSQQMPHFLAGRTIQGIGGGGMVALVYILQSRFFDERLIPRVVACMSVVWMVSSLFGPMIGGVFATLGLWRYAFVVFAAQALLLVLFVFKLVPKEDTARDAETVALPVLSLILLTVSIFLVCTAGTTEHRILSALLVAAGVLLLLVFVWFDSRHALVRMLPIGASTITHPVASGLALVLCLTACLMSFVVYGPIILIRLYGMTPLSAGFVLVIEALAWGTFALLFAGKPASQERQIILFGSVAIIIGLTAQTLTVPSTTVLYIALALIISCGGFGSMWGYVIKRITGSVMPVDKARASSIMPVTQQIGFALGAALAGVLANSLGLSDSSTNDELRALSPWLFAGFYPVAIAGCLFAWLFTANGNAPVS